MASSQTTAFAPAAPRTEPEGVDQTALAAIDAGKQKFEDVMAQIKAAHGDGRLVSVAGREANNAVMSLRKAVYEAKEEPSLAPHLLPKPDPTVPKPTPTPEQQKQLVFELVEIQAHFEEMVNLAKGTVSEFKAAMTQMEVAITSAKHAVVEKPFEGSKNPKVQLLLHL